jgi:hypothetical protein
MATNNSQNMQECFYIQELVQFVGHKLAYEQHFYWDTKLDRITICNNKWCAYLMKIFFNKGGHPNSNSSITSTAIIFCSYS